MSTTDYDCLGISFRYFPHIRDPVCGSSLDQTAGKYKEDKVLSEQIPSMFHNRYLNLFSKLEYDKADVEIWLSRRI